MYQIPSSPVQVHEIIQATMESRLLPLFFACFSLLCLLPICVVQTLRASGVATTTAHDSEASQNVGWLAKTKAHVRYYGGYTIFSFMLVRLTGTVALLMLSITTPGRNCQQIPNFNICVDSMTITYVGDFLIGDRAQLTIVLEDIFFALDAHFTLLEATKSSSIDA